MIAILKRYAMALVFLLLVVILMIFGTMGVTMFGEKMLEDTNVTIKPRGEKINL
jgi:hypothetical protein